MKQFLLVYRQSTGTLLEVRDLGEDVQAALNARFAAEHQWQADRDVEVVVLSAASQDALMQTHARYFRDRRRLAADLDHALTS